MNAVFVSGTVNTQAQLKMGDQGYLLTFKLTHQDEFKDAHGKLKQIATNWSVSLQYDEEPTDVMNKLEKGMKVLVKGNPEIFHKEVDNVFEMNCFLQGQTLNFLDTAAKSSLQNVSQHFTQKQSSAMAS